MVKLMFLCLVGTIVPLALSALVKAPFYQVSTRRLAKTKSGARSSQPTDYYHANISIGTPPQTFTTWIMATISYAWVADLSCRCPEICAPSSIACEVNFFCGRQDSECCNAGFTGTDLESRNKKRMRARINPLNADNNDIPLDMCNPIRTLFDSSKSSTYKADGTPFNDTDAETTDIWDVIVGVQRPEGTGFMGVDTVKLGSLQVPNAKFGQGKRQALEVGHDQSINGVLGLGPSAGNPPGVESPVVAAFKQGLIAAPIATLWLNNTPVHRIDDLTGNGEITYGGVDEANCVPISAYHNISATADDYGLGWFVIADVTLGNATLSQVQVQFDFSSGVSGMFGGALYKDDLLWGIDADGVDYVVPSKAVVYGEGSGGDCSLDFSDYGDGGQLVFGQFFLRHFCHSFDIGKNRIGFGKNLSPGI